MQLYKSIRKIHLLILKTLLISGVAYGNPIGDIVESKGVGTITRNSESVGNSIGTEIILKDEAQTRNGRMKIVFLDNEVLDMTENTYAYIDEAYYDPDPNLSKMSLRMVQGTARFTSGMGNRIKKANIKVSTPTAQISIKGTDFTTTIDELGRSLIILLPDEETGESSGEIEVTNNGGTITLTEAYATTMVSTYDSPPSSQVTLNNITPNMIDNMFIVNPPQEVKQQLEEQAQKEANEDQGLLDIDFLEFNELEQDSLEDTKEDLEFSELDIDVLDVDFLTDLLDVIDDLQKTQVKLSGSSSGVNVGDFKIQGASPGFNKDSQFNVFSQDGDLYLYREVNGTIKIIIQAGNSGFLQSEVEGYSGVIEFGNGDPAIEIIIKQQ